MTAFYLKRLPIILSLLLLAFVAQIFVQSNENQKRTAFLQSEFDSFEDVTADITGGAILPTSSPSILEFDELSPTDPKNRDIIDSDISGEGFIHQNDNLFHPTKLFFSSTPVCIPSVAEFEITNPFEIDLELLSITSNNVKFHPVIFQPQTISPSNSVYIEVLFLPYLLETAESELIIQTNVGEFRYPVEGRASPNPYHIHPFLSNKAIVGYPSYDQPVHLYNPHRDPIHILEIFTTVDFISLKGMPFNSKSDFNSNTGSHEQNDTNSMWIIHPGEEKEVISFSLSTSMRAGVHSGFLHIKTDHDNLVIPIETELTDGGIKLQPLELDFGILTNKNQKKTLDLSFTNNGANPVKILDIFPRNYDPQISVSLFSDPIIPRLHESQSLTIGTITYSPKSTGEFSGELIVLTNVSIALLAAVEIKYSVKVYLQKIDLPTNVSIFKIDPLKGQINRSVVYNDIVRSYNIFSSIHAPTIILGVYVVSCEDLFYIINSRPTPRKPTIYIGLKLREVYLNMHSMHNFIPRTCWLDVETNYSSQRLPLYLSDGRLEIDHFDTELVGQSFALKHDKNVFYYDAHEIDLGQFALSQPRDLRMIVTNYNPFPINIKKFRSSHDACMCLRASWVVGFKSIAQTSTVFLNSPMEDYHHASEKNKCICTKESNLNRTQQFSIKPGTHHALTVVFDSLHITRQTNLGEFLNQMILEDKLDSHSNSTYIDGRAYLSFSSDYQETALKARFVPSRTVAAFSCEMDELSCQRYVYGRGGNEISILFTNSRSLEDISISSTSDNYQINQAQMAEVVGQSNVNAVTMNLDPKYPLVQPTEGSCLTEYLPFIESFLNRYMINSAVDVWNVLTQNVSCTVPGKFRIDASYLTTIQMREIVHRLIPERVNILGTNLTVRVRSTALIHSYSIKTATVELPTNHLPTSYQFHLAASSSKHHQIFLEVSNPFSQPVDYFIIVEGESAADKQPSFGLPYMRVAGDITFPVNAEFANGEMNLDMSSEGELNYPLHCNRPSCYDRIIRHAVSRTSDISGYRTDQADSLKRAANLLSVLKSKNISTAVRVPNLKWNVPPRQTFVIGPIDVLTVGRSATTNFSIYIYNSFTGYEKLHLDVTYSQPNISMIEILNCSQSSAQKPMQERSCSVATKVASNFQAISTGSKSSEISVVVNSLQDSYSLEYLNTGSSATISNIQLGNLKCSEIRNSWFNVNHEEMMIRGICRHLPLQLQHNQTMGILLKIAVLEVFDRYDLKIQLFEGLWDFEQVIVSSIVRWNRCDSLKAEFYQRTSTVALVAKLVVANCFGMLFLVCGWQLCKRLISGFCWLKSRSKDADAYRKFTEEAAATSAAAAAAAAKKPSLVANTSMDSLEKTSLPASILKSSGTDSSSNQATPQKRKSRASRRPYLADVVSSASYEVPVVRPRVKRLQTPITQESDKASAESLVLAAEAPISREPQKVPAVSISSPKASIPKAKEEKEKEKVKTAAPVPVPLTIASKVEASSSSSSAASSATATASKSVPAAVATAPSASSPPIINSTNSVIKPSANASSASLAAKSAIVVGGVLNTPPGLRKALPPQSPSSDAKYKILKRETTPAVQSIGIGISPPQSKGLVHPQDKPTTPSSLPDGIASVSLPPLPPSIPAFSPTNSETSDRSELSPGPMLTSSDAARVKNATPGHKSIISLETPGVLSSLLSPQSVGIETNSSASATHQPKINKISDDSPVFQYSGQLLESDDDNDDIFDAIRAPFLSENDQWGADLSFESALEQSNTQFFRPWQDFGGLQIIDDPLFGSEVSFQQQSTGLWWDSSTTNNSNPILTTKEQMPSFFSFIDEDDDVAGDDGHDDILGLSSAEPSPFAQLQASQGGNKQASLDPWQSMNKLSKSSEFFGPNSFFDDLSGNSNILGGLEDDD